MRTLFIRFLLSITASLPLRFNHWLGTLLGHIIERTDANEQRTTALTNLKLCFPKQSLEQQAQLRKKALIETGKTIIESGTLWFSSETKFQRLIHEVHGEELIQAALAKGKGVILAVPHLGSWEAVNLYCSARYPLTSLYRPPRLEAMGEMIRQARQRFGAKLVPTNAQGVRTLFQALANNEMVMILPDQDPRDSGGHFAPFFGVEANTITLLSRLTHKTGAVVVGAYAERLPHGQGFNIHFREAPETVYEKEMATSVTALNQLVEQCVQHIPEQYQWGYKRFRSRPNDEPHLYPIRIRKRRNFFK